MAAVIVALVLGVLIGCIGCGVLWCDSYSKLAQENAAELKQAHSERDEALMKLTSAQTALRQVEAARDSYKAEAERYLARLEKATALLCGDED